MSCVNFDKLSSQEIKDLIRSVRGNHMCLTAAFATEPSDTLIANLLHMDVYNLSIKLISADFCKIKTVVVEDVLKEFTNDDDPKGLIDRNVRKRDKLDSIEKHHIKKLGFKDTDEGTSYVSFDYYVTDYFYARTSTTGKDFIKHVQQLYLDRFINKGKPVKLVSELSEEEIGTVRFNGRPRQMADLKFNIVIPATCSIEKGAANLLHFYNEKFVNPLDQASKRKILETGVSTIDTVKNCAIALVEEKTGLSRFDVHPCFVFERPIIRATTCNNRVLMLGTLKDGIPVYNSLSALITVPSDINAVNEMYLLNEIEYKNKKFLDEKYCTGDTYYKYTNCVDVTVRGSKNLNVRTETALKR